MMDTTDLHIRAAEPSDLEALNALVNLAGFRFGTMRMPFEAREATRKRLFEGGGNTVLLVAERGGSILGMASLARSSGRRAHVGGIGMGVHDDHQGRGIGRQLLTALIDVADNWMGLVRLELSVNVDNEPALALYASLGFEIEGRERQSLLRDGVLVDAFTMSRLREPPGAV